MKTVPPAYAPSLRVPFQFAWDMDRCTAWLNARVKTGRWHSWGLHKVPDHYGYVGILFN